MLSLEKKGFAGILSISIIRSGGVKNTEPNISVYLVTSKRQWAQNEKQEIHIHAKNTTTPFFFLLSGQGLQQLGPRVCGVSILGDIKDSVWMCP